MSYLLSNSALQDISSCCDEARLILSKLTWAIRSMVIQESNLIAMFWMSIGYYFKS